MSKKAPGKSHRKGISLVELTALFPDEATARDWFAASFWPQGPICPYCRTTNVQANVKHKTMTHRCRECPRKPFFSLKTGTVMEGSKLGYRVWAIAIGRAGPPSIRTVIVSASHFQPEMKPRPERYDPEAGLSKTPAETEKDEQRRTSTGMSAFIASPYERTRPRRLGMPGRVPITAKG